MAAERHTTQQGLNALLAKLDDPDPDIRYMSLNDLLGHLNHSSTAYLGHDSHASSRVAEGVLHALVDQHGEVQNQALKW
jgi:cullin-associated NEDD8-dissociated protein 1